MTPYCVPRYAVTLIKEPNPLPILRSTYRHSEDIYTSLRPILDHQDREHMYALFLDTSLTLIGLHHIATGSLTEAIIHPREVFKCAILLNAHAIILAHNHPSGNPSPSQQDRTLTDRIVKAGHLLNIAVVDHLIIGDQRYHSFSDHGQILSPQHY